MTATMTRPLITPPESMEPVPVFVYGTLRVGEGNYSWCADAVVEVREDCTTQGRIYDHGYPVAKFDEQGTIKGDVLWFDPTHRAYERVCRMEFGAGYGMVEIKAEDSETGEVIPCWGFHYMHMPRGALIESGDWRESDRLKYGDRR